MTCRPALLALCVASATTVLTGQGRGNAPNLPPLREVTVTAIPGVIAAGAAWNLVWAGTDNADGLIATEDGGLLFAQEQPNRVSKLDDRGRVSSFVEDTHGAGSLAFDRQGRLIAAQRTCTDPGRNTPCAEPTTIGVIYPVKDRKVLADTFNGMPLGRLNDLVVGAQGTVYFTVGGAFAAAPGGRVTAIGENLRTNGIMLSPDEKTLYITNGATVVAFDVRADGSAANQRDFARLEAGGSGDGMAIDAAGRLYVTSQPGVQVFDAAGKYLGLIPTPRNSISVAFAGRDKKRLFIVGSGALDKDGKEATTPPGVRNNAKSIFAIDMLAQGFGGRAK